MQTPTVKTYQFSIDQLKTFGEMYSCRASLVELELQIRAYEESGSNISAKSLAVRRDIAKARFNKLYSESSHYLQKAIDEAIRT